MTGYSQQTANRRAFIWNMISSILYSGMSTILLFVTVRISGTEISGIFSLAFASSQLMQTIGLYGVRNYQVTDVEERFPYSVYLTARIWTTVVMILVSVIYGVLMGYSGKKLFVVLLFCAAKVIEAFADVFEGLLQQRGRLDLAAKGVFGRSMLMMILYSAFLFLTKSLVLASIGFLIGSLIGSGLLVFRFSLRYEKIRFDFSGNKKVFKIMIECTPLFLSSLLFTFIASMPKVSIDLYLGNEAQTYFNIVYMPAFLLNLFSGFIFRPFLTRLANDYSTDDYPSIRKWIHLLCLIMIALGAIGAIFAYWLGIPLLSVIFGVDLTGYRSVLMIVILGGTFCALANLIGSILTVMRWQYQLLAGYGFSALVMLTASGPLTRWLGIRGTAIAYTISMGILLSVLIFLYCRAIVQKQRKKCSCVETVEE